ncbi:MAG: ABC transporter substrate-binding protein [Candidatus Lustribacter sp.]|jgi:NitT/TauT family transport system substrate-binding protein
MRHVPLNRASALGLLAAAAALPPLRASAQAVPLRLGVESGAETFAELAYGANAGIFARAGMDAQVSMFPTAGPISAALAGNALDIGTVDLILLANAVNHGLPFVAIASSGLFRTKEPTSGLCVPSASAIRKAKDFEGTTIALGTLVSLTSISLKMWLTQGGADLAKVQFVEMKFTEMAAALQRGTINAAYMVEPMLTQYANQIKMVATPYSAIADTFPISVIITTRAWLAQNADLAKRFVKAVYETARYANGNRNRTAVDLAKSTGLDVSLILRMHRTAFGTSLDAAMVQPVLDAAVSAKLIDRPVAAADLIARVS